MATGRDNMDRLIKILDSPSVHYATKTKTYRGIAQALESEKLSSEQIQRLIVLFNNELEQYNMKFSPHIFKSLKVILPLIDGDSYPVYPELVETAKLLIKHLITTATLQQARDLMINYYDLLMLLPEKTMANFCQNESDLYRLVDQFLGNSNIDWDMKKSILLLLQKYYQAIPVNDRSDFVHNGMNTWLSRLLPSMFILDNLNNGLTAHIIEEMIPEIVKTKYVNNSHWLAVLKNVNSADGYTTVMIQLLKSGNIVWGHLWRCITKLLRPYLRKADGPITPLLSVLESAFIADKISRCEAFNCWSVLIENFVLETKEIFNAKQIKLIVTPLDANNAKLEEIAAAKFTTWWHLLNILEPNIYASYTKSLMPFLNFCFGDPKNRPKAFVIASDFTAVHKRLIMSYTEIIGHEDCSGCVDEIEKFKNPVLNNAIFEPDHKNWLHYTKMVITLIGKCLQNDDEKARTKLNQNMKCIWYSFLQITTSIKDKVLYSTVFKSIMTFISSLTEECSEIPCLAELLLTIIFPAIVDTKHGYPQSLLNDSSLNIMGGLSPIQSIMVLIFNKNLYQSQHMENKSFNFDCFIETAFEGGVIDFCGWILPRLSGRLHSPQIWCCLAETLCKTEHQLNTDVYKTVLLWPINNKIDIDKMVDMSISWKHLLSCLRLKITSPKNKYDEGILVRILEVIDDMDISGPCVTGLFILPIIIRQRFKDSPAGQAKYLKGPLAGLEKVLANLKKTEKSDLNLIGLCGALDAVVSVLSSIAERRTPYSIKPLVDVTKLIAESIINESHQVSISLTLSPYICRILRHLNTFLLPLYFPSLAVNAVHICLSFVKHKYIPNVFKSAIDVLKEVLKANEKNKLDVINIGKINEALTEKGITSPVSVAAGAQVFKTPQSDGAEMVAEGKSKYFQIPVKKSSNVEYVVIRPTWKFQANKLTDHQLEVLKRKREDIPALYEDLSQSLDNTINSWTPPGYKSDTVDDSSKSVDANDQAIKTNGDKLPATKKSQKTSPSVVTMKDSNSPQVDLKILDKATVTSDENSHNENINIEQNLITPKKLEKTPGKGSFRSRLNKNFLKLRGSPIETGISPVTTVVSEPNEETPVTPDLLMTPVNSEKRIVKSNTGPADLGGDRPSRIKRKPNKFYPDDDCFEIKKRRASTPINDCVSVEIIDVDNTPKTEVKKLIDKITEIEDANENLNDNKPATELINVKEIEIETVSNSKNKRRSRLELQLAINTVEGNPAISSETNSQRLTRKRRHDSVDSTKSPTEDLNKNRKADSAKGSKKLSNKKKPQVSKLALCVEPVQDIPRKLTTTNVEADDKTVHPCKVDIVNLNGQTFSQEQKNANVTCEPVNPPDSLETIEVMGSPVKKANDSAQNDISSDIFSDSDLQSNKNYLDVKHSSTLPLKELPNEDLSILPLKELPDIDLTILPLKELPNRDLLVKNLSVKKSTDSIPDVECSEDVIQSSQDSDSSMTFIKTQRRISTIISGNKPKTSPSASPKVLVVPVKDKFYVLRHDVPEHSKSNSFEDEELAMVDCEKLDQNKSDNPVNDELHLEKHENDNLHSKCDQIAENLPDKSGVIENKNSKDKNKVDSDVLIHSKVDEIEKLDAIETFQEVEKLDLILTQNTVEKIDIIENLLVAEKLHAIESEGLLIETENDTPNTCTLSRDISDIDFDIKQKETTIFETESAEEILKNHDKPTEEVISEMDTEPVGDLTVDVDDCFIVEEPDELMNSDNSQLIAEADTQPMVLEKSNLTEAITPLVTTVDDIQDVIDLITLDKPIDISNKSIIVLQLESSLATNADVAGVLANISDECVKESDGQQFTTSILSSPNREDNDDRNADFLNSTLDISPIKGVSLAETSDDNYDELKTLSSPDKAENNIADVPIEISPPKSSNSNAASSPEIFCSEKLSPEKIDASPPRSASLLSSPSSMLAQKKNRTAVSRAAQMLGLCNVDMDSVRQCVNRDKAFDSGKKDSSPIGTPVRKNLHNLYGNGSDAHDKNEDNFENKAVLGFNKLLPSPFASPAGPILKINHPKEDHTVSPSSKRKRVSFHDPPVSTSINVEKYIEGPQTTKSPQPARNFRDEFSFMKSPKRMVVKCLVKKMETESSKEKNQKVELSIETDKEKDSNCDSQISDICSLVIESPQVLEVTSNHLLNDDTPIYPSLCRSKASISEIASKLSSPMWKDFFLKDLITEISTIGDLASKTELQINRLPIKSPKIATVLKVLAQYESTHASEIQKTFDITDDKEISLDVPIAPIETVDIDLNNSPEEVNDSPPRNESLLSVMYQHLNNKTKEEVSEDFKISFGTEESVENFDVPSEFKTSTLKSLVTALPEETLNAVVSELPASLVYAKLSTSSLLQHMRSLIEGDKNFLSEAAEIFRPILEADIRKCIVSESTEKVSEIKKLSEELSSKIAKL